VSYRYEPKSKDDFEKIAEQLRDRFPHRVGIGGFRTDVEGIIDDFDLRIIPRPWNEGLGVDAYVAKDPQVIVVNERLYSNTKRLRFTFAEELSHRLLEWNLWLSKELPKGCRCHELTRQQYQAIEHDAKRLAAEILMPSAVFEQQFKTHWRNLESQCAEKPDRGWLLRTITDFLAGEFDVSTLSVGVRLKELKLISPTDYKRYLGPSL
jgi:Zn-dependent peptidase ImmA (M78 family)